MQRETARTRAIVETGIMSATIVIIMILTSYIQLLAPVAYILAPVVIALVYVRQGTKYGVAASFISIIFTFITTGLVNTILVAPVIPLVGIPLEYCMRKQKKVAITILYTAIGFLIYELISLFLLPLLMYSNGFIGMISYSIDSYNQSIETLKNFYISSGVSKELVNQMFSYKVTVTLVYEAIAPLVAIMAAFLGAVTFKFTEVIFKRLNMPVVERRKFTYFSVPSIIFAPIIILICVGLLFKNQNMIIGDYIYLFSITIFLTLLLLDAVAYMSYVLRIRLKIPKAGVIIVILILMYILSSWFVVIGILDTIFDFRKLRSSIMKRD